MTSTKIRRLAAAASVCGMAVSGAVLASVPASGSAAQQAPRAAPAAAGSCSGSLIERVPVSGGGKKIGTLVVYYDSSTGKNCARLNHGSKTWGKKRLTYVYLAKCKQKSSGHTCTIANAEHDKGKFKYYAGPVRLRAKDHCIFATGYIKYNGTYHTARTYPAASHCG